MRKNVPSSKAEENEQCSSVPLGCKHKYNFVKLINHIFPPLFSQNFTTSTVFQIGDITHLFVICKSVSVSEKPGMYVLVLLDQSELPVSCLMYDEWEPQHSTIGTPPERAQCMQTGRESTYAIAHFAVIGLVSCHTGVICVLLRSAVEQISGLMFSEYSLTRNTLVLTQL